MSHETLLLLDGGNSAVKFQLIRIPRSQASSPQALWNPLHTQPIHRIDNQAATAPQLQAAWKNAHARLGGNSDDVWRMSWVSVGPQSVQQAVCAAIQELSGHDAPQPWQPVARASFSQMELQHYENHYAQPGQLGADRWVSGLGLACQGLAAPGETHMVISAGTATTIDLIRVDTSRQAAFLGGWILPGMDLMQDALRSKTRDLNNRMEGSRPAWTIGSDLGSAIPVDSRSAIAQGIALAQTGFVGALARQHQVTQIWLQGGHAAAWRSCFDSCRPLLGSDRSSSWTVQEAPHLAFVGLLALDRYRA